MSLRCHSVRHSAQRRELGSHLRLLRSTRLGRADGLLRPRRCGRCDRTPRTAATSTVRVSCPGQRLNRTVGQLGRLPFGLCQGHWDILRTPSSLALSNFTPAILAPVRSAPVRLAPDGQLFANERGAVLGTSSYWRVWQEARPIALPPDKVKSPLAHRPYDLRHTCITNWLNAGVPVAEVARRAGNSPEVIHRRYEGCIDGHEESNNRKMEKAMGWSDEH